MSEASFIIDRVKLHWGHIPVKLKFSYGAVDSFPFAIVRVCSAEIEGAGEIVVPITNFLEDVLPTLLGRDARCLDTLLPTPSNDHQRMLGESISIALYDLVGRISGLPLWGLLGGSSVTQVPLMPCVFPTSADDAAEKATLFFSQGYKYLKTKLVGDLAQDLATVRAIRSAAPEGVVLQGDANRGYKSLRLASKAVRVLGDAGLDIFEDPLDGNVHAYAKLTGTRGAKVMVDELARSTDDLVSVIRLRAADVIGIHPDQAGSLSAVMQHVRIAQAFNFPVVIGGTGYTGPGSAAYQHLTAVATPGGPCGELGGFFDHGMPRSFVREPLPMKDGCVQIPDTPGIGVELDEDALNAFSEGDLNWAL